MLRVAFLALLAVSLAGCELARTTVPYEPVADAQSDDWAAARAVCARDGRIPVMRYEHTMLTRQTGFRCEPPGQSLQRGAPASP